MKFQHILLKKAQLQEDIDALREELSIISKEVQDVCPHREVVKSPFKAGTFLDSEEFRVCKTCGAWELGWRGELKATETEQNVDGALDLRSQLTRNCDHESRL